MFCAAVSAEAAEERVLILYSYHQHSWTDDINEGISSVLNNRENISIRTEYMDTKWYDDDAYLEQLRQLYVRKYSDITFNTIIAADDNAYDFTWTHQKDLFKDAPIVFCGVSDFNPDEIEGREISGIMEIEPYEETLSYALRLLPNTEAVYLLADLSSTAQFHVNLIRRFVQEHFPELELRFFENMTNEQVESTMRELPENTFVLMIGWWADTTERRVQTEMMGRMLVSCNRPVFGVSEFNTSMGMIMGGCCISPYEQGYAAAEMTVRILEGEKASAIPVDTSSDIGHQHAFYYPLLKRHGISPKQLPKEAVLYAAPLRFYQIPRETLHILVLSVAAMIVMVTGGIYYAVHINRFRKRLALREEHFRDLVETSSDWIWEMDATGRYTYASPTLTKILGYRPEEILGKTPFDLMDSDGVEYLSSIFESHKEKQSAFYNLINTTLHKDGRKVILESSGVPFFYAKGELAGYRGIDRDITDRVKAEQLLKLQRAELHSIFRAAPIGIGLTINRNFVRVNARLCDMLGYREDELVGQNARMVYPTQEDYDYVGQEKYDQIAAHGTGTVETRWQRKDGSIINVLLSSTPFDSEDWDKGVTFTAMDVTERVQDQQKLRKSEAYLSSLVRLAPIGICVMKDRAYVSVNESFCDITGYSKDELIGRTNHMLFESDADFDAISKAIYGQLRETGMANVETQIRRKDGSRASVFISGILLDPEHLENGVLFSGLDISKLKQTEAALAESEQRYRTFIQLAAEGIARFEFEEPMPLQLPVAEQIEWITRRGILAECNDVFARMYGYHRAENLIGARIFDLWNDADAAAEIVGQLIRDNYQWANVQTHEFTQEGIEKYFLNNMISIIEDDRLTAQWLSQIDITEEVRNRQALEESEERFRNIVNSSPMGIHTYMLEPNGRLVMTGANRASSEILRMGFSDKIGLTIEKIFPILAETEVPDIYRRLCREGGVYHGDNFEYHDGVVGGYYEFTAFQTSPGKMATLFTDVTERITTEKALRFTQFAVDHTSEEAYWIDSKARLMYVNDAACEVLGYSREELLKMTVHDIDPDFPAEAWPAHWDELKEHQTLLFESKHKTKSGRIFPVEITSNFLIYDESEYNCAFARDISERKAAEQMRELLMEQLHERNDELQSIVYTATHDLRSPLVNITGFTGELEKGLVSLTKALENEPLTEDGAKRIHYLLKSDIAESLEFVKSGSLQMNLLLNGLLHLSRVGSAQVSLSKLDVNTLLKGVIQGLQFKIQKHNARITISERLPECMGDVSLLGQVFTNLLDNAIKYHHPDRAPVITITASVIDHSVEYAVTDNGIGIEWEHLDKVFELFHRLGRTEDKDGEGIGLTIVRRILDRMEGSVRIDSEPGKGTTVYVRMPSAK